MMGLIVSALIDAWIAPLTTLRSGPLPQHFFFAIAYVPWVGLQIFTCALPLWCSARLGWRMLGSTGLVATNVWLEHFVLEWRFGSRSMAMSEDWIVLAIGFCWFGPAVVRLTKRNAQVHLTVGAIEEVTAPRPLSIADILSTTLIMAVGLGCLRMVDLRPTHVVTILVCAALGVALSAMRLLSLCQTPSKRWVGRSIGSSIGVLFFTILLGVIDLNASSRSLEFIEVTQAAILLTPAACLATVLYWFVSKVPILWLQACRWQLVDVAPSGPAAPPLSAPEVPIERINQTIHTE
ncbi:MAG: hypothetical protein AAGC97_01905 [Planctomycetota bacterium]